MISDVAVIRPAGSADVPACLRILRHWVLAAVWRFCARLWVAEIGSTDGTLSERLPDVLLALSAS